MLPYYHIFLTDIYTLCNSLDFHSFIAILVWKGIYGRILRYWHEQSALQSVAVKRSTGNEVPMTLVDRYFHHYLFFQFFPFCQAQLQLQLQLQLELSLALISFLVKFESSVLKLSLNKFFDPTTPSMRKGCDGEQMENKMENK